MNNLLNRKSEEGFHNIGRNPHDLTLEELADGGFTPHTAAKAIRRHCYECMGESWKCVAECGSVDCALWPFRMGTRPKAWQRLRSFNTENYPQTLQRGEEHSDNDFMSDIEEC